MFFFEIRKTDLFSGSPFSDHFWRLFSKMFASSCSWQKYWFQINEPITFSIAVLHAVLDAVLEDKSAQPLPCGSYLVTLRSGEYGLYLDSSIPGLGSLITVVIGFGYISDGVVLVLNTR